MSIKGVLFLCHVFGLLGTSLCQLKPLLINCGSDLSTDADGRTWVGDSLSSDDFTLSNAGIIGSTAINEGSSFDSLYRTARIFNTSSLYKFNVVPGLYCVRLHFFPFSFGNLNVNDSAFDVTANDLKLVSKFNVPREISVRNSANSLMTSLVKEYFLNASADGLQIEFLPDFGSFAFINAIEVVPVLSTLFSDSVNKVGTKEKFLLGVNVRGIETLYRLNVGGPAVNSSDDTELWRRWDTDERYMLTVNAANTINNQSNIGYASVNDSSIAPLLVYESARTMIDNEIVEKKFNVSWKFYIDPNFDYLVRLHFCELIYDKANQRIFRIYINNKTAAEDYDIFAHVGGKYKAYHEDYVDVIPQQVNTLWLQLGPETSTSASSTDALLNGVEIFKLSKGNNLAHASERITAVGEGSDNKKSKSTALWAATGAGFISLVTASVAFVFFCHRIRKRKATSDKETPSGWHPLFLHEMMGSTTNARSSQLPHLANDGLKVSSRLGRMFTITEIRVATRNFDESLVIGTGGFGKVYKGVIDEGIMVAIKRGHPLSEQGLAEFETEIEMLSKLRHRHLVSMIGYCDEQREKILVYEYMANGTLRSHLYSSDLPPLSWRQRIEACIGAAKGLHYLHTGADRGIIHRDVKTTNILLDENFVAKVSDFGLSKAGPALDHTHVSTAVKGSFGYLDPEYYRRQHLTQKSDVYSFGVVLFEVVCARPVINPSLAKDQINLAEWALRWQRQRSLESIVDPHLRDYSLESLKKFGEIAEKCLADDGKNRPTMGEVLWHLEYALQLHEAYKKHGDRDSFGSSELSIADMSFFPPQTEVAQEKPLPMPPNIQKSPVEPDSNEQFSDDTFGGIGFSKLVSPRGR